MMNTKIKKALAMVKESRPRMNLLNSNERQELEDYARTMIRKPGPYGCKCKTLRERVLGDGCDECNQQNA